MQPWQWPQIQFPQLSRPSPTPNTAALPTVWHPAAGHTLPKTTGHFRPSLAPLPSISLRPWVPHSLLKPLAVTHPEFLGEPCYSECVSCQCQHHILPSQWPHCTGPFSSFRTLTTSQLRCHWKQNDLPFYLIVQYHLFYKFLGFFSHCNIIVQFCMASV